MTAIALAAVVPLLVLARRWERAGRPERYVGLVVGFLLVECLLYPTQSAVPNGPFRIPLLGGSMRTQDYLVAVGVLGRMTVRPLPRRVSSTGVVWVLTFVWLLTAAARGLLAGHDTNLVLFSAGSLLGLFGSALLVAGCDAQRLIALLRSRVVLALGAVVALLIVHEASGDEQTFLGTDLGILHVDTASVFVALGTFALLVEWSARTRRRWPAWAALPLLLTPFTIPQRATLVQLVATLLVVGWAMTQYEWQGRIHVARVQLLKGLLALVAIFMVVLLVQFRDGEGSPPFAGYYEETFEARNQIVSAQARRDSFGVGMEEWAASWPYGYGLGHTYRIQRPFGPPVQFPATFDNVPLDLLVRTGAVGFLLCIGAFAATIRDGLRAWRRHPDGSVAALALAAVAVLVGVGLKAVFESILEKDKIAVLIGLTAGAIASAARSLAPPAPSRGRRPVHPSHQRDLAYHQGDVPWS